MKIALAQLNYHIGHFESNVRKITDTIREAKRREAGLVIFAELAVCGYPPRDFLEFSDFIDRCDKAVQSIARECMGISAIVGSPARNPDTKGKDLYNAAFVLSEGRVLSSHYKTLLPNYDVFDEYRYFEPNSRYELALLNGRRIAVTICEDLWNIGDDPLYRGNPMDELSRLQPDMIVNIAASPFHYDQAVVRKRVLRQNAEKYRLPLFYVNHVGAQTELLFDGGSMALNASGTVVDELGYFRENLHVVDLEGINDILPDQTPEHEEPGKTELIHDALVMGIRNYFRKLGFEKAILGLSGGVDSAVTLVLACEALGPENVRAVLMPSAFSSDHSVEDARQLAENLNVRYDLIPVEEAYQSFLKTLYPLFSGHPFDIAEENLQARVRGVILMAICNKFGYILLNTSNKSEAAVGYGTLYGDMNGGLAVLGDVYKTEVYELARFINREQEVIPASTILKPPSAELRPGQKDSDSLPEYDILDRILYHYIEQRLGPNELIAMGFDEEVVRRTLSLVNTNEYKRYQTPPILRVSPKAFGMGRRMPIVARYLT
ncbi:MAG: NAD+ synthase [Bacteroidales bacterium]|nr:NAD+ synthase [Bacteroidales bacterium]